MSEEKKPFKKQGMNTKDQISRYDWNKPVKFTPPPVAELRERIKNLKGWFPDAVAAMKAEIEFQLNREAKVQ